MSNVSNSVNIDNLKIELHSTNVPLLIFQFGSQKYNTIVHCSNKGIRLRWFMVEKKGDFSHVL